MKRLNYIRISHSRCKIYGLRVVNVIFTSENIKDLLSSYMAAGNVKFCIDAFLSAARFAALTAGYGAVN